MMSSERVSHSRMVGMRLCSLGRSTLPDNYNLSLKRLYGLLHQLRQDEDVLNEYDSIIRSQIQQGIVEVVEEPEQMTSNKIHYLPQSCHHLAG